MLAKVIGHSCESSVSSRTSRTNKNNLKKWYGNNHNFNRICSRCEQNYKFSCSAKGVQSHKCNLLNHYARFCKTKVVKQVACVDKTLSNDNLFFIGSIQNNVSQNDTCEDWHIVLKINNNNVNLS